MLLKDTILADLEGRINSGFLKIAALTYTIVLPFAQYAYSEHAMLVSRLK